MKQFGLIGFPLGHSFSKAYFTEKFAKEGITDAQYENYPLSSIDQLPELIGKNPNLGGLNVTIPYKESVIEYLDGITGDARQIGAVNCILIADKKMTGHNTDFIGFEQSLIPLLKSYHRKALILGTGGSSKAIAYALHKLHIDLLFVSRRKQFQKIITYDDLTENLIKEYLLIINTTPVGMFPDINSSPDIPYALLTPRHILFDLVYNPVQTIFLKLGNNQGAVCINGRDMLKFQAEASWKIWNEA